MIPDVLIDLIGDEGRAFNIDPRALLHRDIDLKPPTHWSPNRHCQLVETADGWVAVNLAREDDRVAVPAWLECDVFDDPWEAVALHARHRATIDLITRATLLGLPIAAVGEALAKSNAPLQRCHSTSTMVLDLSALWAGPLCGGLLAKAGLDVIKIEDPARPDSTRVTTPAHDQRLNGRKRRISLKLDDRALMDSIATARVLITSARAHALARLGLTPEDLFAHNPGLLWVAITAHGFTGTQSMRVGFGDDCAAAGGLVGWEGGRPHFLGDALADPMTGLRAARLTLDAVAAGHAGLIDIALASTAADFAARAALR